MQRKLVVVGNAGVGKSSLIRKALGQEFEEEYKPTNTPDFFSISIIGDEDKEIMGQLWDIGGSASIGKSFLRGTHGVVLVVDISAPDFLSGLDEIYTNVAKLARFADDSFPCIVLANKKDLVSKEACNAATALLTSWCERRRDSEAIVSRIVSVKSDGDKEVFDAFSEIFKLSVKTEPTIIGTANTPSSSPVRIPVGQSNVSSPSNAIPNAKDGSNNSKYDNVIEGDTIPVAEEKDEDEDKMGVIEAKVVLAGAPAVGKTSILRRFADKDSVTEDKLRKYDPTIGADFRLVQVPTQRKMLRMQIWDTAGDRKMISLGRSIYRNADFLILVYDITSAESFQALDVYYDNFVMYGNADDPDAFPCLLVGNKCDVGERATELEEVMKWCAQKRPNRPITHIECSALRGIAVSDIFIVVAEAIAEYEAYLDGEGSDSNSDSEDGRYTALAESDGDDGVSVRDHHVNMRNIQGISRTRLANEGARTTTKSCIVEFTEKMCTIQ